jgi:hypothetical protein
MALSLKVTTALFQAMMAEAPGHDGIGQSDTLIGGCGVFRLPSQHRKGESPFRSHLHDDKKSGTGVHPDATSLRPSREGGSMRVGLMRPVLVLRLSWAGSFLLWARSVAS